MTACEAITVATVASTTSGKLEPAGTTEKNGLNVLVRSGDGPVG